MRGEVHIQTVQQQLAICERASLETHASAMYRPTLRQIEACLVTQLVVGTFTISDADWKAHCRTPWNTPLARGRAATVKLLQKRPAAVEKDAPAKRKRKRTAFTRKRIKAQQQAVGR
jgi:hypothetical protein